jgi:hypothetical protein
VNQNFITGVNGPTGITVSGAYVYWANGCGNSIGRADLNGSDVLQNFISGPSDPSGLAAAGGFLYWGNFSSPQANGGGTTIGRSTLGGGAISESFINGATSPAGIAVSLSPCVVPNLVGKRLAAAKRALTLDSCTLGKVRQRRSTRRPGIVLSQSPKRGTRLTEGSKITLTLSKK